MLFSIDSRDSISVVDLHEFLFMQDNVEMFSNAVGAMQGQRGTFEFMSKASQQD